MNPIAWSLFYSKLLPELITLARFLYSRHQGNVAKAKDEIQIIRDHWASLPIERADIDRQLAELRAQGK